MRGYYTGKLSGERLRRCYEVASPRVRRYLEAEIRFVLDRLHPADRLLELGCGYGRVLCALERAVGRAVGIDTARESLELARRSAPRDSRCEWLEMDALALDFADREFDKVVCVQNGVCSFGVGREALAREALRVTRPGGSVFFSTYAERFWKPRLAWFERQAAEGLLGPIDRERTVRGTIVCADGFRSGLVTPEEFRALGATLGLEPELTEVDGSSLFCVFRRGA